MFSKAELINELILGIDFFPSLDHPAYSLILKVVGAGKLFSSAIFSKV